MKKTLIALTLASLSAAAVADVTIYGNIRAGVYNHSTKQGSADQRKTMTTVDDFSSYVGFKGAEDVAGGLKAIWQVETALYDNKAQGTNGSWANRNTFIGLEGGFGKVRAGFLGTQFQDMGAVDQWEYTGSAADGKRTANGLDMFTRTDVRLSNALRYDSPVWGGFSFNLTHGFDEEKRIRDNHTYSTVAGLNYENAGWFAQYGYGNYADTYSDTNGKLKNGQAHRLEVGYNANNLFVGLGYQNTKGFDGDRDGKVGTAGNKVNQGNYKDNEIALSGAYTFGALTPKLTYAHGFKLKPVNGGGKLDNAKYDQVIGGLDYALSKRTTAMFSVGYLVEGAERAAAAGKSTGANAKVKTLSYGVGLRHLF